MEGVAAALRRLSDLVCKEGVHAVITGRSGPTDIAGLAAKRPRDRRRGGRRWGRVRCRSGRSAAGRIALAEEQGRPPLGALKGGLSLVCGCGRCSEKFA